MTTQKPQFEIEPIEDARVVSQLKMKLLDEVEKMINISRENMRITKYKCDCDFAKSLQCEKCKLHTDLFKIIGDLKQQIKRLGK